MRTSGLRSKKGRKAPISSGSITGDTDNIDKVRDLLFGAQARDFNTRIGQLEKRLVREAAALQSELQSRLDSLEEYTKTEIKAVTGVQVEESKERKASVGAVTRDQKKADDALRRGVEKVRDKLIDSERELRESLLQESKKLAAEIQKNHALVTKLLEDESRSIREAMTHRGSLGDLLTEMGLRLKDELRLPEPD